MGVDEDEVDGAGEVVEAMIVVGRRADTSRGMYDRQAGVGARKRGGSACGRGREERHLARKGQPSSFSRG